MKAPFWLAATLCLALASPAVAEPLAIEAVSPEVVAPEPLAIETPTTLEVEPARLGLTPVFASSVSAQPRPQPLSFTTAALLTYGLPWLSVLAIAPLAYVFPAPSSVAPIVGGVLFFSSFASGYIYAGEPGRGALVTLGDWGVITAGMLVGGLIAVAVAGPGQQAGFVFPLIGAPIALGSWVAYQFWKMGDLHAIIDRKNKETAERQHSSNQP